MAVKQNRRSIRFIKDPSIQLAAVGQGSGKQNGYAIRYIKNPSKELQLTAVKRYGYAIEFINYPSATTVAKKYNSRRSDRGPESNMD